MFAEWQIDDLLDLLRLRYPRWDGFEHPPFVSDEIRPKRVLVAQARETLSKDEVDKLIASWEFDELLQRLERLGRSSHLLFNRVPRQGDLAILYGSGLDAAEFSLQVQRLLYSAGPTAQRLQAFSAYCLQHSLPNKWTFPTFFLFITHPREELFVKPQVARWFLRFLGLGGHYTAYPDGEVYATLRRHAHGLLRSLQSYGARDMVDVHSFLWVCSRESRSRTGRLDVRGQVELDVPPTTYTPGLQPGFLSEDAGETYGTEQTAEDGVTTTLSPTSPPTPVWTKKRCPAGCRPSNVRGRPSSTVRRARARRCWPRAWPAISLPATTASSTWCNSIPRTSTKISFRVCDRSKRKTAG